MILSTQKWHQIPQVKGSGPQDHFPFESNCNPTLLICASDQLKTGNSIGILLGFNEFSREAHRTEKTHLITHLLKGYNSGTTRRKRCIGQGVWEGPKSSHTLTRLIALPVPPRVPQSRSSPNLIFTGSFMAISSGRYDWLHH